MKPVVYFFRSLNTTGGDLIQVGPFNFGFFWSRLDREFTNLDLDFRPVTQIGGGSLFEQAEKALDFIQHDEVFNQLSCPPVHFLGHSAGGLVMKLVAEDPKIQSRLSSLITIGTPHHGTPVATWAAQMDLSHPKLAWLLGLMRYSVKKKKKTFESFDSVTKREFHFSESILTGSVLCAPPKKKWSRTYRWIHRVLPEDAIPQPCDGLIELESQKFGTQFWHFDLDHIQQVGFGGQHKEFVRMCQQLSRIWHGRGFDWQNLPAAATPRVCRAVTHTDMHPTGSIVT